MAIEHLRQDQGVLGYKISLESEMSIINRRGGVLRSGSIFEPDPQRGDTLPDLITYRELVMGEITTIEQAIDSGEFHLPDDQIMENVFGEKMDILLRLPLSPSIAVSPLELVLDIHGTELKAGTKTLFTAQNETFASVQKLDAELQEKGWRIATATPEEYGGEKHDTELRYYLDKVLMEPQIVQEITVNQIGVSEDLEIKTRKDILVSEPLLPSPTLEENRLHALQQITEYLQKTDDSILREHQIDVFASLLEFFSAGNTSGTIILPTGAGKTYIAAELIRALDLPTLMFSTSKEILGQNRATIAANNPGTHVTNYYGNEKDLTGRVINTLYQSFPSLSKRFGEEIQKFGLVIYDEADLSLGEERHKIHAQFPNAIKIALTATPYYEQLSGYEDRGIVTMDDEWTETFTNTIHEMSPEEAFERGVIPPLDICLVRTNTVVPSLPIGNDGNFNPTQLARYINTKSRNAITLAMIAGTDRLTDQVLMSQDTTDELARIHKKIKGKRTVIHGVNVQHILDLETSLRDAGISAKAIYGTMNESERRSIIEQVRTGEIQVVLGDQLTGRGLDIPELEVGIHAAPTLSSREVVQEVGRLFRHSPDTGKEKGIAIQLVDTHQTQKSKQPILIPSIFDADFILSGSTKGRLYKKPNHTESGGRSKSSFSPISIEGTIDLDAYFEEIKLQDILQSRFKHASVHEINKVIYEIYGKLLPQETQDLSLVDVYADLARELPSSTSAEVNQKAIEAISSGIPENVQDGMQVIVALNLKTALRVIEPYLTNTIDFDNDLVQHVLTEVSTQAESFHDRQAVSGQFYKLALDSVRYYIAREYSMPLNWVKKGIYQRIDRETAEIFNDNPGGLDSYAIDQYVSKLSALHGVPERTVRTYLVDRNKQFSMNVVLQSLDDPTSGIGDSREMTRELETILETLPERERFILTERFFNRKTLEEVAVALQVSRERIRQIEAQTLRKMRHPSITKRIR